MQDYTAFSETVELEQLLDFTIALGEELFQIDFTSLNKTEIENEVKTLKPHWFEPIDEPFMMYMSQFRTYVVLLIRIFERTESRSPVEIDKNHIRAKLDKVKFVPIDFIEI